MESITDRQTHKQQNINRLTKEDKWDKKEKEEDRDRS